MLNSEGARANKDKRRRVEKEAANSLRCLSFFSRMGGLRTFFDKRPDEMEARIGNLRGDALNEG